MGSNCGRSTATQFTTDAHFRGDVPCSTHISTNSDMAPSNIGIDKRDGGADTHISDNEFAEDVDIVANGVSDTTHRTDREYGNAHVIRSKSIYSETEISTDRQGTRTESDQDVLDIDSYGR